MIADTKNGYEHGFTVAVYSNGIYCGRLGYDGTYGLKENAAKLLRWEAEQLAENLSEKGLQSKVVAWWM